MSKFDTYSLAAINRALIGFDNLFESKLTQSKGYPPYNIVKLDSDNYAIEVAVAGFSKNEITVSVDQSELTIKGVSTESDKKEYIHRGLASRNFEQKFILAEYMEVLEASVVDGLLTVRVKRVIPESLKPRLIELK